MVRSVEVEFVNENKKVRCGEGTLLSVLMSEHEIPLEMPCAGKMKCGKCRVRIEGGEIPITEHDERLIRKDELDKGLRLACAHPLKEDIRVYSLSGRATGSRILGGLKLDEQGDLDPPLKRLEIELDFREEDDSPSIESAFLEQLPQASCISAKAMRGLDTSFTAGDGAFSFSAVMHNGEALRINPSDEEGGVYTAVFDLGTTTLAAAMIDMESGKVVSEASAMNNQKTLGHDVISRISAAIESQSTKQLHDLIIRDVNELLMRLCEKAGVSSGYVYELVFVGNSTIIHTLLNLSINSLGVMPFIPVINEAKYLYAEELGIEGAGFAKVYSLPLLGDFVGADTSSCILSSGIHKSEELSLLIDIGTNSEIVLGNKDFLLSSSAPAGPAFEGADIEAGMRAQDGAIDKAEIVDGDIKLSVIGGVKPCGICGSGLIDLCAVLLELGVLSTSGELLPANELPESAAAVKRRVRSCADDGVYFVLHEEGDSILRLTQKDFRNIQLAKGAVSTIYTLLLMEKGLNAGDIERIFIAGAFGSFIRKESALRIGLLPPDINPEKIESVGNAALRGAALCALSKGARAELETAAKNVDNIEFAGRPEFQMTFAESMFFPES